MAEKAWDKIVLKVRNILITGKHDWLGNVKELDNTVKRIFI